VDFDDWRYLHDRGVGASTQGQPIRYAVAPNNALKIGPKADSNYVLRGWYQQSPTVLAADGDIPAMPSQFHEAIVWYALWQYGMDIAASEKVAKAETNYRRVLADLEKDQLPKMSIGGPLV
jgi:hypothetical protein